MSVALAPGFHLHNWDERTNTLSMTCSRARVWSYQIVVDHASKIVAPVIVGWVLRCSEWGNWIDTVRRGPNPIREISDPVTVHYRARQQCIMPSMSVLSFLSVRRLSFNTSPSHLTDIQFFSFLRPDHRRLKRTCGADFAKTASIFTLNVFRLQTPRLCIFGS